MRSILNTRDKRFRSKTPSCCSSSSQVRPLKMVWRHKAHVGVSLSIPSCYIGNSLLYTPTKRPRYSTVSSMIVLFYAFNSYTPLRPSGTIVPPRCIEKLPTNVKELINRRAQTFDSKRMVLIGSNVYRYHKSERSRLNRPDTGGGEIQPRTKFV